MKKLKQLSLFSLALAFILSSCSMEKRQYMPGYYVSWKSSKHINDVAVKNTTINVEKTENNNSVEPIATEVPTEVSSIDNSQINENSLTASADKSIFVPATPKIDLTKKHSTPEVNKSLPVSEIKAIVKAGVKENKKANKKRGGDVPKGLLYVLCFFIPFLAVGLATNWDINKVLINILLTLLCGIPGIIHALIVVSKS